MDDEGDFKKARGFLLTYSALVLALCYFGADLTQFKLMGNEVQLHQRTNSAWLVLAIVNIYFWFRCYQRVPKLSLYFDEPMNNLYDRALVWATVKIKRRALNTLARTEFFEEYAASEKIKVVYYAGKPTAHDFVDEAQLREGGEAEKLHQLSRSIRTSVTLSVGYQVTEKGAWLPIPEFRHLDYEPGALVTLPVKAFTIARGAFVTPWFTDYIAPLALGAISTSFALWKWCDMNFFTTTLTQGALLCAK